MAALSLSQQNRNTFVYFLVCLFVIFTLTACGGGSNASTAGGSNVEVDNDGGGDGAGDSSNTDDSSGNGSDSEGGSVPDVDDSDSPPDIDSSTEFLISSQSPQDGADTRSLETAVVITFNKPIMAVTAVKENFTLEDGGSNIDFTVDYSEGVVTLNPSSRLDSNTTYTVSVGDQVMSEEGEALAPTNWSFTTAGNLGSTSQDIIDTCMSDVDLDMLDAVNSVRATGYNCANGQMPATTALAWSCVVADAAVRHSTDMATNNFHSHTGSDGSSHVQRMVEAGFPQNRATGENIAAGYQTVADALQGWLTSETGHCSNIMNANYTHFGSARVIAPAGTTTYGTYWTQNFGRP